MSGRRNFSSVSRGLGGAGGGGGGGAEIFVSTFFFFVGTLGVEAGGSLSTCSYSRRQTVGDHRSSQRGDWLDEKAHKPQNPYGRRAEGF